MSYFCDQCKPHIDWCNARWRRIVRLDVTAFRWPVLLITLAWGVVLAKNPQLLDIKPYDCLGAIGPSWAWALAMFGVGTGLLFGTLVDSRRVVRIGLIGTTALWTFTALVFGFSDVPTGFTTYAIVSLMSAWALMQVGPGNGWS